ncbi:MAG: hypothetical protein HC888_08735 [Candidatus Competibacteraceae bacterium]|nr:hypothetical protein [Candidatus Competibacteraceae bacterium]
MLHRIREGVARRTGQETTGGGPSAASAIFVMFDTVSTRADYFNHAPAGSNVLYMDGHVEFYDTLRGHRLRAAWDCTWEASSIAWISLRFSWPGALDGACAAEFSA